MGKPKKRNTGGEAAPVAVSKGNVFASFIQEATSIGNEVAARRALQEEVAAFLAERGLTQDFETWRAARAKG